MFNFNEVSDLSILIFLFSFPCLLVAIFVGRWVARNRAIGEDSDEIKIVLGATLSLLALLIGFTLSMSITGFNNRQSAEETEAQVIKSTYYRATLLSALNMDKIRYVLKNYTEIRIKTYQTSNLEIKERYRADALLLVEAMWKTVVDEVEKKPNPANTTILNSFIELISAQQKTVSDWRHQIPSAAWTLLIGVAILSHFLIGCISNVKNSSLVIRWALPFIISLSFFMISEIDAPGQGLIRVAPTNLLMIFNQMHV
ncbi:hypothetical protein ABDZ32_19510 [Aeromonas veronii]|uniref:bestrophin-like domain n=1 Tax=Aeromonas veronii TaxID=654 RepID=UPI0031FE3A41